MSKVFCSVFPIYPHIMNVIENPLKISAQTAPASPNPGNTSRFRHFTFSSGFDCSTGNQGLFSGGMSDNIQNQQNLRIDTSLFIIYTLVLFIDTSLFIIYTLVLFIDTSLFIIYTLVLFIDISLEHFWASKLILGPKGISFDERDP